jgi:N-acetylmuramoyl-L-alanine amidase
VFLIESQTIFRMMKRCILQFLTFLFILIFSLKLSAQNGNGFDKIVLDAGHGGYDKGAIGKNSFEKDLTLAITLKAGKLIQDSLPGIRVIYTRKNDVFVELHKRAAIANESKADLFISVHCNSNLSPKPFGAETYVMGLHKTSENLEVAKTENAAILMEENYLNQYDGFDPSLDEDYITLNMFQSAHIEQSLDFSQIAQNKMMKVAGMHDRGVKQAGFVVLYLTTMPGILLETGFISNPAEEKFLLDPVNQDKIALAILEAVKDYKFTFEKPLPTIIEPVFTETKIVENTTETIFRIGFASFTKLRPLNDPEFKHLPDVKYFYENGSYLYTFGAGLSKDDALSIYNLVSENKWISKKYLKNAEIITFENSQIKSRESVKLYLKKKE